MVVELVVMIPSLGLCLFGVLLLSSIGKLSREVSLDKFGCQDGGSLYTQDELVGSVLQKHSAK